MPAAADTKAALQAARAAIATATVAVAAARELWNRDATTDGRMGTMFPIPFRFPLELPGSQTELDGLLSLIARM